MKNLLHPNAPQPDPETEEGCGFMHKMLDDLADGNATGVKRWYTETHVAGCPHCSAALARKKRERQATVPLSTEKAQTEEG